MQISIPSHLTDTELVAAMKGLLGRERGAAAQLVAHLAEMDTRDVHLRLGYGSLYLYCRDALRLSEWEAYNRIEVARTARRFPTIFDMLADGSLNLTAVRLLTPHLTPGNHGEVLESARGKTKPEVQEIVARLSPRPDAPSSVRRLPTPRAASLATPEPPPLLGEPAAPLSAALVPASSTATCPPTVPPAVVTPLSPDRYKLQVTIGGETLEKLRLAKDMLAHAVPSGDDAAVLDRALTALLVELARKKFADTRAPRSSVRTSRADTGATRKAPSRHVPAAVRRIVWVRDLGRCAFVEPGGHRCSERRFVEFHHVDPYALGGEATVDGIQLRCRSHNDYEGRLYFGKRRAARELVPEQVAAGVTHSGP